MLDWVVGQLRLRRRSTSSPPTTHTEASPTATRSPAGITVVRLDNQADEYHEIILIRRNEGTTESLDELLALPEDEATPR